MRSTRIALLIVGVLAGLVYLNSLGNEFALDDTHLIRDSENVGIDRLGHAVTRPYWDVDPPRLGMYRPVTSGSFAVGWDLWNGSPVGFHAVNVVLHVLVSVLVFFLVLRLHPSLLTACLAGAVFAVHPVHVEAVANIVGRGELLAALFYLLGCHAYLRLRPGWRRTLAVSAAYFLAIGSKEIAVTLPAALVLLELAGGRSDAAGTRSPGGGPSLAEAARRLMERWTLLGAAPGAPGS